MDKSKRVAWADQDHAVEGGGQLDGVTCEIKNAEYLVQDDDFRKKYFKGKGGEYGDAVALFLEYHPVDGGEPVWKSYGIGKADSWEVLDDGDYYAPVNPETTKGVHKNSGYFKFLSALVEAGYPATREVDGASGLNGTVVVMVAVETGKTYKNKEGKEMPDREPLPSKVVKLGSAGSSASTVSASIDNSDEEVAKTALQALLVTVDAPVAKKDIVKQMNANIEAIGIEKKDVTQFFVKYYQKDQVLKGWADAVKLEGGKVSLA